MVLYQPFNHVAWDEVNSFHNFKRILWEFTKWAWKRLLPYMMISVCCFAFSTYLYATLADFPSLTELERLGVGVFAFVTLSYIYFRHVLLWTKTIKEIEERHIQGYEKLLNKVVEAIKQCQRNQQ